MIGAERLRTQHPIRRFACVAISYLALGLLMVGVLGCAAPRVVTNEAAAHVTLSALHPHFAAHQVKLLDELQRHHDGDARLVSVTFSEHWGRLQVVDRTVAGGTLVARVYRTVRDAPDAPDAPDDIEVFDWYATDDERAIAALLRLMAECAGAGDYQGEERGEFSNLNVVTRWNVCLHTGGLSSCKPPVDLARFVDNVLVLKHGSMEFVDGDRLTENLGYHPAKYLDLAIRVFDEVQLARHDAGDGQ